MLLPKSPFPMCEKNNKKNDIISSQERYQTAHQHEHDSTRSIAHLGFDAPVGVLQAHHPAVDEEAHGVLLPAVVNRLPVSELLCSTNSNSSCHKNSKNRRPSKFSQPKTIQQSQGQTKPSRTRGDSAEPGDPATGWPQDRSQLAGRKIDLGWPRANRLEKSNQRETRPKSDPR